MGRNIKKQTNGEVKGTDTTVKESWITRVCGESKLFFVSVKEEKPPWIFEQSFLAALHCT
jgi:hypothetical protein